MKKTIRASGGACYFYFSCFILSTIKLPYSIEVHLTYLRDTDLKTVEKDFTRYLARVIATFSRLSSVRMWPAATPSPVLVIFRETLR
jgi:hypothetical protein